MLLQKLTPFLSNKVPPSLQLTVGHLETLEFDRFNVVDQRGHLLCGVDLTAGCALWKAGTTTAVSQSVSRDEQPAAGSVPLQSPHLIRVWLLQISDWLVLLILLALPFTSWQDITMTTCFTWTLPTQEFLCRHPPMDLRGSEYFIILSASFSSPLDRS